MTEISPALPAHAEPTRHEPLAGLVMGDAAVAAPRRHGLPGQLFIASSYVMSVSSAFGVVAFAFLATVDADAGFAPWTRALATCVWAVLQWRVADEVRRFSRWGWYGAMAELGIAAASKVVWVFLLPEQAFAFLVLLGIEAGLLRYFWNRRAQFDVDFG